MQEVVVAEVEKRKEQIHCVLCLGHNKGMEEAATSLAVSRESPAPCVWMASRRAVLNRLQAGRWTVTDVEWMKPGG